MAYGDDARTFGQNRSAGATCRAYMYIRNHHRHICDTATGKTEAVDSSMLFPAAENKDKDSLAGERPIESATNSAA